MATRGDHSAVITTKLILWLQTHRENLPKSTRQVKALFDKEHNSNMALKSVVDAMTELGIAQKKQRSKGKKYPPNDRLRRLARVLQYLILDIEEKTGMEPGSLGLPNQARQMLANLCNGVDNKTKVKEYLDN